MFTCFVCLSDFLAMSARLLGKEFWRKLLCRDAMHIVSESLWCKLQAVRTVGADGPLVGLPLAKKSRQGLYKLRMPNSLIWFFSQSIDKLRRLRQHFDRYKLSYDKITSGVPAEIQRIFLQIPSLGTVCTDCPSTDKFFYTVFPEITILLNIQLRALHMKFWEDGWRVLA